MHISLNMRSAKFAICNLKFAYISNIKTTKYAICNLKFAILGVTSGS